MKHIYLTYATSTPKMHWRDKRSVNSSPVGAPSFFQTTHFVDHVFGVTKDGGTDNTKKHTKDSSINADQENEENITDAKIPAKDIVVVLLSSTEHHQNPLIDIANTRETRVEQEQT